MGCDVDLYHPEVREELVAWGKWFVDTTNVDGFRLDALKHIPYSFVRDWLNTIRTHFGGRELFAVGEYWSADVGALRHFLGETQYTMQLFDVPLHFRFVQASKSGSEFDLTTIFDHTLVTDMPTIAVTFVDNHDTQPGAGLESWVEPWFKPLAYAMILLREVGYPCVFAGDYFGGDTPNGKLDSHQLLIDRMLEARRKYGYGEEIDYFDHPNCIAWLRTGDEEHPGAKVVVLSNGDSGIKRIKTLKPNAVFKDVTGHSLDEIRTDENGEADFTCPGRSVSVWVQQ
ncbi:MAG TPA: DUF1939 domain-containing protein, partial [Tepidisphaeraceae bacterium]|nr:DUF1939 domain-containing protein [Tepidisphaeraceae bacterium]